LIDPLDDQQLGEIHGSLEKSWGSVIGPEAPNPRGCHYDNNPAARL
jgi:hypothetical protein